MNQESYLKTHKRISELNPFTAESGDPVHELLVRDSGITEGAYLWSAALDSETSSADDTLRLGCERMAFLTPGGKVPARNLPSYISYIRGVDSYENPAHPESIDYVYKSTAGGHITYYRWYEDADTPANSKYIPIANNLELVDGDGTRVVDNPGDGIYTRKVSIEIGEPAPAEQNPKRGSATSVLQVQTSRGALVHTTSGVPAGTYPASPNTAPGFGGVVKVPVFDVNSTGHVTSVNDSAQTAKVTIPSTAADSSDPNNLVQGLVKVGTSASSISGTDDPGTYAPTPGGYVEVSAYDHTHDASTLTLKNLPHTVNGQVSYADIDYDMASDVTVSMGDVLHASVPSASPGGADCIFDAPTTSTTAWDSVSDYWPDNMVYTSGTTEVDAQAKPIGTLSDIPVGKPVLITLNAEISIYAAPDAGSVRNLPDLYTATFTMCGVSRTVTIPAQYARSMAFPVSLSMIVIPSSSSPVMTVDTATVFSVKVNMLAAKQLR